MKKQRIFSRVTSLALAAALGLSLAACGGDTSQTSTTPADSSTPAQTGAVATDAAIAVGSTGSPVPGSL